MPHSNMHEFEFFSHSIVHMSRLCFGHFWPFSAFPHMSLPPKLFWVEKLSPNKFDKGAYTLFRICPTRICMISNLFRTPLYIFCGFVLAISDIFGQYQHVLISYTPQYFLEWCIKPEMVRQGMLHLILNLLDPIMHMVPSHMSALTDLFSDSFGHFVEIVDQFLGHSDQIKISRYPMPPF